MVIAVKPGPYLQCCTVEGMNHLYACSLQQGHGFAGVLCHKVFHGSIDCRLAPDARSREAGDAEAATSKQVGTCLCEVTTFMMFLGEGLLPATQQHLPRVFTSTHVTSTAYSLQLGCTMVQ